MEIDMRYCALMEYDTLRIQAYGMDSLDFRGKRESVWFVLK